MSPAAKHNYHLWLLSYKCNKLCRRLPQYTPATCDLDLWPWKWYPSHVCVPILLFLGLCSRLKLDVCDRQTYRRQTGRQTSDARQHHHLMPPPRGRGHNKTETDNVNLVTQSYKPFRKINNCVIDRREIGWTSANVQVNLWPLGWRSCYCLLSGFLKW